ncbi:beta-lactamase [Betaproteobacteria bacterium]|nr:beta-lactamase [Betaproteobacteria bacterium]
MASGAASCLAGCALIRSGDGNAEFRELERAAHACLGMAALDVRTESFLSYRGDERFPMCSTAKLMIAGAILRVSMRDTALLSRRIEYDRGDFVPYSPITEKWLAQGMTVAQLCAATLQYSDNTAGNLLLRLLGGPEEVTAFAREIGDEVFRLDRWEPDLNSAIPGDERDTTTPLAMVKSMRRLLLGDALALPQRARLQEWMRGNTTGDKRIRAGVPPGWTVADKTGAGAYGVCNDVGVLWPPGRDPVVLALYTRHSDPLARPDEALIAEATRRVVRIRDQMPGIRYQPLGARASRPLF